jgi:diguanylate cyclase (GGDEF)-like protein
MAFVDMKSMAHEALGIAVVDDDEVYRTFLSQLIVKNSSFKVFEAPSGAMLSRILDTETVDCIVLDYNLGTESGFSVKDQLVRRKQVVPPIVMLTGDGRESTVIKALRLGINDYMAKRGLNAGSLISSISRVVEEDREIRQEKAEYQRLVKSADADFVTGLLGRAQLDLRLTQIASLPDKIRVSYALILMEVAELRAIVERFGLKSGDQALRAVAERLRAVSRDCDICGRYSDNSFLIILDVGGSSMLLEEISARISSQLAFRIDLNSASFELSACVGTVKCEDIQSNGIVTLADLARAAEQALAEAKSSANQPQTSELQTSEPGVEAENLACGDALRASERRSEPRHRVLRRARMVVPAMNSSIDCTVRNVSVGGVGLRIDAAFAVPPEFDLVIDADKTRRRVRVCWQIGTNLGAEYLK